MTADLTHVDVWVFDLDNTLYPIECEYMLLIEGRMTDFVMRQTRSEEHTSELQSH